jgi:uncharacterized protein YqjF (DUF2071 family)
VQCARQSHRLQHDLSHTLPTIRLPRFHRSSRIFLTLQSCVSVEAVVCSSAFRLPYVTSLSECNVPVKAIVYNTIRRIHFPPSACRVSIEEAAYFSLSKAAFPSKEAVVCSSAFRLPYVSSFSECNVPVEAVAYNTNSHIYFPPSECNLSVDAVVCSSAFRLPYVASFSECNVPVKAIVYNTIRRIHFPPSACRVSIEAAAYFSLSKAAFPSKRSYVVQPSGCRMLRA